MSSSPSDLLSARRHPHRHTLLAGAVTVVLAVAATVVGLTPWHGADIVGAQAPPPGATVLNPTGPCRLFDSRLTPDLGRIDARSWRVQTVGGPCGVPANARAVAISIVVMDVEAGGYLTAWPSDVARPEVSNVNYEGGNTVANSAVVRLPAGGTIDVFLSGTAKFAVDVTGYFGDAGGATDAGRFVPMEPTRVVDTRISGGRGTNDVVVPLPAGVPADARMLAVTLTSVEADGFGFLTAYPAGAARPNASVVNTDSLNPTRANLAFVPVSAGGFVVARSTTSHVLVDVWGWFTGPSASDSTEGLFVPQSPQRVWDTRHTNDPVHPGGTVERRVAPPGASAVVANLTGIDLTDAGYLTVQAAGTARPNASSLNYRWRHPVAALTITRTSDRGVAFYSSAGAHIAVDVAGWFVGRPVAAGLPVPANPYPGEDAPVVVISDSAHAGIRWNGAVRYLQGANFDARLESCRRLIGTSCRGREGYAPRTAVSEIQTLAAGQYHTLVMLTGYNDWSGTFPTAVQAVMQAARDKGIERVVWMTYRENVGYVSPSAASNSASFAANNATLHSVAPTGRYPELILADWHRYSINQPWFTADGVHLTVGGAPQSAIYISRKLAFLERRPCPAGIGGPVAPGGWCADPDATGPS